MNLKQVIFLLVVVGLVFCSFVFFEAKLYKTSFYEAFIVSLLDMGVIALIGGLGIGFMLIYDRLGD